MIHALLLSTLLLAQAPDASLPASADNAKAALESSPRHGEYIDVKMPGGGAPIRTWISYPERKDKAGVVIVIQEVFGLTDWLRAVADQLAKEGFIAVAPDMVSGLGPGGGGTESVSSRDDVVALTRGISPEEANKRLDAVRDWAIKLPAANGKSATVGFCWGGGRSFAYAGAQPGLDGAVVYYGASPDAPILGTIKAPGPGPLRRRRRAGQRDHRSGRSRDEEAREDLRASHLRGGGPRLPPRPGSARRREHEGHARGVAADGEVSEGAAEVG